MNRCNRAVTASQALTSSEDTSSCFFFAAPLHDDGAKEKTCAQEEQETPTHVIVELCLQMAFEVVQVLFQQLETPGHPLQLPIIGVHGAVHVLVGSCLQLLQLHRQGGRMVDVHKGTRGTFRVTDPHCAPPTWHTPKCGRMGDEDMRAS